MNIKGELQDMIGNFRFLGCAAFLAVGVMTVGVTATAAEKVAKSHTEAKSKEIVGNRHAPWLIEQMNKEINKGLRDRGIEDRFAMFRSYAGWKLDSTADKTRHSEVDGNCRLKWYDHLMRNPLKAPVEAEQFTRELHRSLRGDAKGLDRALTIAREKMDAGRP